MFNPETDEAVEKRRLQGCCIDCGRKYGDAYGFPDLVVPHDVWAKISPTGDEGGLLCPSCMCRRAWDAGLENVEARFTSGPFLSRPSAQGEREIKDAALCDLAYANGAQFGMRASESAEMEAQVRRAIERHTSDALKAIEALNVGKENRMNKDSATPLPPSQEGG